MRMAMRRAIQPRCGPGVARDASALLSWQDALDDQPGDGTRPLSAGVSWGAHLSRRKQADPSAPRRSW